MCGEVHVPRARGPRKKMRLFCAAQCAVCIALVFEYDCEVRSYALLMRY